MTCRSSVAAALAAVALGGTLAAQQPQPQAGDRPATHVVQQGETLWALAQRYLGDPLLWPEIYRLNTDVVEDPHWIFPGEELRLAAAEAAAPAAPADSAAVQGAVVAPGPEAGAPAAAAQEPRPAAVTTGPTIFAQPPAQSAGTQLQGREARAYRTVREGEYYSSGFLTEGEALPTGTVLANLGTTAVAGRRTLQSADHYDRIGVSIPPGVELAPGDLMLVFRRGGLVEGFGEIVSPTGLLRAQGPVGTGWEATVVRVYNRIGEGQEVLKVAPFVFNSTARPEPVEGSPLSGRVLALRSPREVTALQEVLFIDKGADDGVRLGDMFAIYRTAPDTAAYGSVEFDQARVIIVNTRARTSTGIIVELYRGDITTSSLARLVRRMPS
jgi:hypothetical protein